MTSIAVTTFNRSDPIRGAQFGASVFRRSDRFRDPPIPCSATLSIALAFATNWLTPSINRIT
jgi:hypothetical protein